MSKHDKLLHTMLSNYRCNHDKFRKIKNILHCCFLETNKFKYLNNQIVISLFIQFTVSEIIILLDG